jgi:hypothetical protein
MAEDEAYTMTVLLRATLLGRMPEPTREFRRRAWRTFEEALERHLAGKRRAVRARS